jgi:CcmD family protein
MTDPNDKYLFLAYTLVWIVFMLYAWFLSRRQSRMARELKELKEKLHSQDERQAARQ